MEPKQAPLVANQSTVSKAVVTRSPEAYYGFSKMGGSKNTMKQLPITHHFALHGRQTLVFTKLSVL